ncbi:hypothetical protein [Corynebacterium aquatimens]|uniref:Secreted protein n=1 Tax=Corynebacterium aquatimens TaxID=1190508 RepID=A0A931GWQ3_9CORY|nr:hypothetical protein [Corynebacterium aquatimens]MBG6122926.1 hypothetical protein [Corynebacterium aquatimens]WJY66739.1 hypothetical protein CAQUA_10260 [Corynebacterium aquatimens]
MTLHSARRALIAGATAASVVVAGLTAPSSALAKDLNGATAEVTETIDTDIIEDTEDVDSVDIGPELVSALGQPVPAFAGFIPPAVLGGVTKLLAKVDPGTVGQVQFVLENGTPLGAGDIDADGNASYDWTAVKTGTYRIKARVLGPADATGIRPEGPFTELFDVHVLRPGSSINVEVEGGVDNTAGIGGALGIAASLVLLLGSQTYIPFLNSVITTSQKQLGIFNEDLANQVQRGLPMVGGVLGLIALAASIGTLAKAGVDGSLKVTSSKVEK